MLDLTGHAMDHGWVPHKPETWKYKFATLSKPVVMLHLRNSKEVEITVPVVKAVLLFAKEVAKMQK